MDENLPDITVLIVATRGYVPLAQRLILQLRRITDDVKVQFLVLTDKPQENRSLLAVRQVGVPDYGWPELALRRYEMLLTAMPLVRAKRVVMLDADTSVYPHTRRGEIGAWRLFLDDSKPLFAVQHWDSQSISGNQPPYCYDKRSASYIATKPMLKSDGMYVQGAALGGNTEEFAKLLTKLNAGLEKDRAENVVATWHDESHWNHHVFHNRDQVRIISLTDWQRYFRTSDKGLETADQLRKA